MGVLQFEGVQPILETRNANVSQPSLKQKFSQKVTTDSSTRQQIYGVKISTGLKTSANGLKKASFGKSKPVVALF